MRSPAQSPSITPGANWKDLACPLFTVPTTAGTGAEVTNNAVLTDPARGVKTSIRSEWWYARAALVDPELTLHVSPAVTAASGGDALCQALEAYVSTGAMPITDALCEQAIYLIGRSLLRAYEQGSDLAARADMLYGSLMAGMAFSKCAARCGARHGAFPWISLPYHARCDLRAALCLTLSNAIWNTQRRNMRARRRSLVWTRPG